MKSFQRSIFAVLISNANDIRFVIHLCVVQRESNTEVDKENYTFRLKSTMEEHVKWTKEKKTSFREQWWKKLICATYLSAERLFARFHRLEKSVMKSRLRIYLHALRGRRELHIDKIRNGI